MTLASSSLLLLLSSALSDATTALNTSQSPNVIPITDLSSSPSAHEDSTAPLRFCAATEAQ